MCGIYVVFVHRDRIFDHPAKRLVATPVHSILRSFSLGRSGCNNAEKCFGIAADHAYLYRLGIVVSTELVPLAAVWAITTARAENPLSVDDVCACPLGTWVVRTVPIHC
jgi:hypothetical protein